LKLIHGELSPIAAVLQGRLAVRGRLGAANWIRAMFIVSEKEGVIAGKGGGTDGD
jgi:putative sterol carrier protein